MNYLAHLHLAPDHVEARIGNLLGDFIKPAHAQHLPASMQTAMQLHRWIDQFTDQHPLVIDAKRLVATERQRFAGILLDIYFDHFLARHWRSFHPQSLAQFSQQVYGELMQYDSILPQKLRDILPNMIRNDWLSSYQEMDKIRQVLSNFARYRLRRPSSFAEGFADLQQHYAQFEALFLQFYPQLIVQTQAQAQYQSADYSLNKPNTVQLRPDSLA